MRLYSISSDTGKPKKFAFGVLVSEFPSKKVYCQNCGRDWDNGLLLDEDAEFSVVLTNDHYPHFLCVMYIFCISEMVCQVLSKNSVKGYHLCKLDIISSSDLTPERKKALRKDGYKVDRFAASPPLYYRLLIDGIASAHEKSGVVTLEKCEVCGYIKYATDGNTYVDPFMPVVIDRQSWKGDDLFLVREFGASLFCSEKFVDTYHTSSLTGLTFEEVEVI